MGRTALLQRGEAPSLTEAAAVEVALSLPAGGIQVFCGIGASVFRRSLDDHAPPNSPRSAVFADPRSACGTDGIVETVLGTLADAARKSWPLWYGGADFVFYRATTLDREAARLAIAETAAALPVVSESWARSAAALAYDGRAPRVAGCSRGTELAQLVLAVNPAGLILVLPTLTGEAGGIAAFVQAVEWTARHAPLAVVVLCPEKPPADPAFDRLMYGGRWVETAGPVSPAEPPATETLVWLPPVIGRPHPLSPVEQRMAAALARDRELAPLFAFNQVVRTVRGTEPRVDLLWSDGRLVVELDGYADHAERGKFMADRHRDYELALSGYAVLRIANDEAAVDIERALEKIRDMVRLRRAEMDTRGGK